MLLMGVLTAMDQVGSLPVVAISDVETVCQDDADHRDDIDPIALLPASITLRLVTRYRSSPRQWQPPVTTTSDPGSPRAPPSRPSSF
jgi:hypothetical protein